MRPVLAGFTVIFCGCGTVDVCNVYDEADVFAYFEVYVGWDNDQS